MRLSDIMSIGEDHSFLGKHSKINIDKKVGINSQSPQKAVWPSPSICRAV